VDPWGLKDCPCGHIKIFDWQYFSTCMANELTGFELLGPSISASKKFNKRAFYRLAKKWGKRWGPRLIPGIGWGVTAISFLNGYATCDQKATKCIKKTW
jgi:hypothetical protein